MVEGEELSTPPAAAREMEPSSDPMQKPARDRRGTGAQVNATSKATKDTADARQSAADANCIKVRALGEQFPELPPPVGFTGKLHDCST